MAKSDKITPKIFFLNEQHELAAVEKSGGGGALKLGYVDWSSKGNRLAKSLSAATAKLKSSKDPGLKNHLFLVARPAKSIPKLTDNINKSPTGEYDEPVQFRGQHSGIFGRLGLDLLQVAESGDAVIHMKPTEAEKLVQTAAILETSGKREQAKWVALSGFDTVPAGIRIDQEWLKSLKRRVPVDCVVELQPVLASLEAERVLRALVELLVIRDVERFVGAGTDFSGRRWIRGQLTPESLKSIAEDFSSVQSLHAPHLSLAAASKGAQRREITKLGSAKMDLSNIAKLPVVAIADTGGAQ